MDKNDCGISPLYALFVVALMMVAATFVIKSNEEYQHKQDVEYAIANDYTVYYNGSEIDGTKVNIDKYDAEINDKEHEVYLSDKPVVVNKYRYRYISSMPTVPE